MSSNSPSMDLIVSAVEKFQERMESLFPLRHFTEFYDKTEIESIALREKANILRNLTPSLSDHTSGTMIYHLMDNMMTEKVMEEWLRKNEEHWMKATSVVDTFLDALCQMYKTSVEAELSLDPDMNQKARENLLEVTKSKAICCYENNWSSDYTNIGFRHDQKTKLEMKLDFVKAEITGMDGFSDEAEIIVGVDVEIDVTSMNKSELENHIKPPKEGSLPDEAKPSKGQQDGGAMEISDRDFVQKPKKKKEPTPPVVRGSVSASKKKRNSQQRDRTSDTMNQNSFTCKECNRSFADKVKLLIHNFQHPAKYTCSHCSEAFSSNQKLLLHLGKCAVKCPHCGVRMGPKDNLKEHILRRHQKLTSELVKKYSRQGKQEQKAKDSKFFKVLISRPIPRKSSEF